MFEGFTYGMGSDGFYAGKISGFLKVSIGLNPTKELVSFSRRE